MNINKMRLLSLYNEINPLSVVQEYTESLFLKIDNFTQAKEALVSSQSKDYDLVIVEHNTPKCDALAFIRAFRHMHRETPILIVVNSDDIATQEKALIIGAFDIVVKPISPILFQAKLQNTLALKKVQDVLKDKKVLLQEEISNATNIYKESEHELLDILAKSTLYKEHKDSKHSEKIAHYAKALTRLFGLNETIQDVAFHASGLYDIGKVGIPDEVLFKEGKLNEDEREIIKTHARLGFDLLKYTQNPYLKAGAVISYSHHEKFDGSGYPIGLKGETIPILGRIVAIVEVFEALTSQKVYREAWSIEDACQFVIEEKGKHFDPKLVDLFIENLDEMKSIKNQCN
ncbi:response regulator [Sulfurimonas sp. SAG-AH-194-L11]|nr:HD domain-containing phosphohydrolase [Sulfurimonas sp. SAG-AH-194-L11]MDF1877604.1 response regulator [Sulfurimonas sp. SAG-AH-194-L11]